MDIGQKVINAQLGTSQGDGGLRPPGAAPTTGTGGQVQAAIIAELTRRIQNLEGAIIQKVDGDRVLSMIALTPEAVLIQGDKIGVLGEVTFADWHRDVTGQVTGTVAPSITQIRGGVVRTERVLNFDNTAWIDLDATGTTEFIRSGTGVSIKANGTFTFGGAGNKALVWDGTNLTIQANTLQVGPSGAVPTTTVVSQANFGATRSVGDITADVLSNSATSITMNSSQLFKSASGSAAGVFIGAGGIFGKNSLGQNTFAISGSTGAASFAGDIETAGRGVFKGSQIETGLFTAAVHANATGAARAGFYGYSLASNQKGVFGRDTAGGIGVHGDSSAGGIGVYGSAQGSSSGNGVRAEGLSGAIALRVDGPMMITNNTLVTNLNANYIKGFSNDIVRYTGDGAASTNVTATIFLSTVGGGSVRVPVVS